MLKTTMWSIEDSGYIKEECDHPEVLSQSQETEVLILNIYYSTPIPQIHHCFIPSDSRAENLRCVSGSDYLPKSLSSEELCLAADIREITNLVPYGKEKGSPLGRSHRRVEPYLSVSHLSSSSWLCPDDAKNKKMRGWDTFLVTPHPSNLRH